MKLSVIVANRKLFDLTVKVAVAYCRSRPYILVYTPGSTTIF